ncbi:MAG: hypothetical protein IJ866_02335 [Alphaproteobacteria bacterium]|nr:hypothetical protein [Alphaproteobacteria bacterium]
MQIDNKILLRGAYILGGICVLGAVFFVATTDSRARSSLKKQCGAGMDCACFANIVDNRLSNDQVRAFNKFLNSMKTRPTTNIMEFVDEASAQTISSAISLCRVQTEPAQPTNNKK